MEIKEKILILEGGYNEEHEVSLKSSSEVKKVLNKINVKYKTLIVNPKNFEKKIVKYQNYICFNALHGPFGEDGQIQKILKKNNIRYTHSNIKSSLNCFDKIIAKKIIKKNKILTPRFDIISKKELNYNKLKFIRKDFKKFVIKPNKSGSSFGIKIVKNQKDFESLVKELESFKIQLNFHDNIIIEEFIPGNEITVSTIKHRNKINSLAVTEIKYKGKFFDYKSKYSKGYAKHILPANINKKNYEKCMILARKCHNILGCNSIARTDFILSSKNNRIYFLETNTQPGLTPLSLFPEQARYQKISFKKIIMEILKNLN